MPLLGARSSASGRDYAGQRSRTSCTPPRTTRPSPVSTKS